MIDLNDKQYKDCITTSHSCEENKRRFEIKSTQEERKNLLRFKIDGCIYKDIHPVKRCDYIFTLKNVFSCFIELKGKDIDTAVAQLESSLQNIKVSGKKYAFVVSSRNDHPNAKTQQQKFVKKFKLKYQCSFDIKNGLMGKTIEELKY